MGAGVAGALLAEKLALSGVKVALLEAGPSVAREDAVRKFRESLVKVPECAYPRTPEAMFPVTDRLTDWYRQSGPDPFRSTYLKVVGGTTWHWLGTCLRYLPNDFRLKTLYRRGIDWPFGYTELESYYGQAEQELGVAGDSSEDLGSPRSTAFPMPPIPQTYLDTVLTAKLDGSPYQVRSSPQARNSVLREQRPACCGSASCIPVCPVQAKYDATVHVTRAMKAGAVLHERTTAVRLALDRQDRIAALHLRHGDGSPSLARARVFVLACHAVETPRLLLASAGEDAPTGVANRSDQVGRNLMDHPVQLSWALAAEPVYPYRGPISTSGIENLRDGPFRRHRGAFRIQISNDGWSWPTGGVITTAGELAGQGLRGRALDARIWAETSRHLQLAALIEQDPDPANRITLDEHVRDVHGVPLPRITYRLGNYVRDGLAAAAAVHQDIFQRLGASHIHHSESPQGAGHIIGTTRMGQDPRTSVVGPELRSHDHSNLFIVGAGVFPTSGTANPTLTIAALSLRLAAAIRERLYQR